MTNHYRELARVLVCPCAVSAALLVLPIAVRAEEQQPPPTSAPAVRSGPTVGVQGFGTFGVTFPIASESLTTVGISERPPELGGGVQVTNLWRGLFVQLGASRWTGDGSRVFIDSRGARFDLGIPLNVKATHVDVGAGWRFQRWNAAGRASRVVPYLGGGIGIVDYSETSDFAGAGEDLSERATSYTGFGGVEVHVTSWLGVAADARYRYAKGVLGSDGVSAALGEDSLSGPSASVRVMLGWFGSSGPLARGRDTATSPPARPADVGPAGNPVAKVPAVEPHVPSRRRVLTIDQTPVRIAPDRSRQPLIVLERGTSMVVVAEESGWLRVEFRDPRWGTRVGYVEREHVRAIENP
jgi:hypothetical protein